MRYHFNGALCHSLNDTFTFPAKVLQLHLVIQVMQVMKVIKVMKVMIDIKVTYTIVSSSRIMSLTGPLQIIEMKAIQVMTSVGPNFLVK